MVNCVIQTTITDDYNIIYPVLCAVMLFYLSCVNIAQLCCIKKSVRHTIAHSNDNEYYVDTDYEHLGYILIDLLLSTLILFLLQ